MSTPISKRFRVQRQKINQKIKIKEIQRKDVKQILQKIRHEVDTVTYRVLTLTVLWEYQEREAWQRKIYILLARNISRSKAHLHTDLIEFLLLNTNDPLLQAMCWVMRGRWGYEFDTVALIKQRRILERGRLDKIFWPKKRNKKIISTVPKIQIAA